MYLLYRVASTMNINMTNDYHIPRSRSLVHTTIVCFQSRIVSGRVVGAGGLASRLPSGLVTGSRSRFRVVARSYRSVLPLSLGVVSTIHLPTNDLSPPLPISGWNSTPRKKRCRRGWRSSRNLSLNRAGGGISVIPGNLFRGETDEGTGTE